MKIAVIGAGGVGGYFGGRLAQAGNEVTFVARGEHGEAIKSKGLQVHSSKGDFYAKSVNVVAAVNELSNCDLILLGVKAWQVKGVAKELRSVIQSDTIVIPLQNGVMAAREILEELPEKNVMGGLCNIFSKIKSPGIIEHMSAEPTIVFGELDNSLSERAQKLQTIFNQAGITNKLSDYIQGDIWKKFILICLGGLGALTRANYGVLCTMPELREMLVQMLDEMYTVAIKEGIRLPESVKERTMAAMDKFSPSANSSMARDIWAGRPSELEYQNGSVVNLAKKHGISVPVNHFIYHTLLPQELQARNN
jgi:2-dehydropantoate 2-reductase